MRAEESTRKSESQTLFYSLCWRAVNAHLEHRRMPQTLLSAILSTEACNPRTAITIITEKMTIDHPRCSFRYHMAVSPLGIKLALKHFIPAGAPARTSVRRLEKARRHQKNLQGTTTPPSFGRTARAVQLDDMMAFIPVVLRTDAFVTLGSSGPPRPGRSGRADA
ncbi:hypothetical protein SCHPADRAFT_412578 [Schizopora paradoxa]|uniref:Uncharacterized protein n=1 Tax=Schizopora paradoxa TaxID=27342 RepID=A0A0H2RKQ6_9AGAM|nr:hypothetical protein SCHPADRAFT_412578 [Schizopora paradoxa]